MQPRASACPVDISPPATVPAAAVVIPPALPGGRLARTFQNLGKHPRLLRQGHRLHAPILSHPVTGAPMFTRAFAKDTAERAIATAAQALIAVLGVDGLDWLQIDAKGIAATAAGAAVLSVLKSLVASKVNDPESASLVDLPGKHAADQ